ncbi:MAG: hypothetical protein NC489_32415 [Ruminococcus flavefaciens]|nr:hypothetical protein [Ruminococcus flavefaciens]
MLKRIVKADRVFSFLFLLAFTMTFCAAYFGMTLERGLHRAGEAVGQANYGYCELYDARWEYGIGSKADIKLPKLNNGNLMYGVLASGEDIIRRVQVHVVMEMNEIPLEPLDQGEWFMPDGRYDMPQCVCGWAWMRNARTEGDKEVLTVNGRSCEVVGILKPNGFADSDERMYLYGPDLPEEFLEELIGMEEFVWLDYRTAGRPDENDLKKLDEFVHSGVFAGEPEKNPDGMWNSREDSEFISLMPLIRKFFLAVLAFSFLVCIFLSWIWCRYRARQNMLKRVFGFSVVRIWIGGLPEIIVYEVVSLLLAAVLCFLYEVVRGNMAGFFEAWKYGAGLLGTAAVLLILLIAVVNILCMQRIRPADALRVDE